MMLPVMQTWSWWTSSRAFAIAGKTYASFVDENGLNQLLVWANPDGEPALTTIGGAGQKDDHNNGGIIVRPGKPVVAGYCGHSLDNLFRIKTSTHAVDDPDFGVDFTGQPETQIACVGNTTYAVGAHWGDDDLFFFFRTAAHADNGGLWSWTMAHSADDGATWEHRPIILNGNQFYGTFTRAGARTIRVAMTNHPANGNHPDQNLYYAEIDLLSGDMTKSDGAGIGNIYSGDAPLMNEMEVAATPVDGKRSWAYAVGDATDPEFVWGDFVQADIPGTSRYQYTRLVDGAWRTTTLASAGKSFAGSPEPYLGGAQLPVGGNGGVVYISRNVGDDWYVERLTSSDDGLTFDAALMGSLGRPLVRAWPVEHLDDTSSFEVLAQDITFWSTYTHHNSTIVGLGRSSGPSILRLRRDGINYSVSHIRKDGQNLSVARIRPTGT